MDKFIICFFFCKRYKLKKEKIKEGGDMCKILDSINGLSPEELLKRYQVEIKPPINLAKLVKSIGILSYPYDFTEAEKKAEVRSGGIIGAAISEDDNLVVLYSDKLSDKEARFTIAHELGHCCLNAEDLKIDHIEFHSSMQKNEKEEKANVFAENLLMPLDALTYICHRLIAPTVTVLSEIFQVPTSAVKSRLARVGNHNVIDDSFTEINSTSGEFSDE